MPVRQRPSCPAPPRTQPAQRKDYQPDSYDRDWVWYPWRRYDGDGPHRTTLIRWRALAERLARRNHNAKYACGVCFRPLNKLGEFWLRLPLAAHGRGLDLCPDCAELIAAFVQHLTAEPPFRESDEPWPEDRRSREPVAREGDLVEDKDE